MKTTCILELSALGIFRAYTMLARPAAGEEIYGDADTKRVWRENEH